LTNPAGVTVVQYRDKSNDTNALVENARKLHQITKKYNVPLLINDRVDVALAIGAEGVHLGQDDMSALPTSTQKMRTNIFLRIRASKAAPS
jgi:thiamine-phosphate diphosphorylase